MKRNEKIGIVVTTASLLLCFIVPFVLIEDNNTAFMAAMASAIWIPIVAGFAAAEMAD